MKRRYVEGFSYLIGIISNYIVSILYTQGLTKVQLISKGNFGVFKSTKKTKTFLSLISALASKKLVNSKNNFNAIIRGYLK